MKIDTKKYQKSLREAEEIKNLDSLVKRYLDEKEFSLNYKDYEHDGDGKVTLKNSRFGSNAFANQSWIIQIAGLGVNETILKDIVPNKVIVPISETEGEIKTLSPKQCKSISNSIYKSILPSTNIKRYINKETGHYNLDSSSDDLVRQAAACYYGGNMPACYGIQTPIGEIDSPEIWSEFIYRYLKDWYDGQPYSVKGKYASKYPLIVNLAILYATGGSTAAGLGEEGTVEKMKDYPYDFLLNRLGYFLSDSRKFNTKTGLSATKDARRDIGDAYLNDSGSVQLQSLGYYLGKKSIDRGAISLDGTSRGKDGGEMSNEERIGGTLDKGIEEVENRAVAKSALDFVNSEELMEVFWSNRVLSKARIGTLGEKEKWLKINCDKPFHWRDIFENEKFRDDLCEELASATKKDKSDLSTRIFGEENAVFTVSENEELEYNEDVVEHLRESTKFSKYERLLEELDLFNEAKGYESKDGHTKLIKFFTDNKLDFDKEGNLCTSTTVVVKKDETMKQFLEKIGNFGLDPALFKDLENATAETVALGIRKYTLTRFYSYFLGTGREKRKDGSKDTRQMRGYANIKASPNFFINICPFLQIIEKEFYGRRLNVPFEKIVERARTYDIYDDPNEKFIAENELTDDMKDMIERVKEIAIRIFPEVNDTNFKLENSVRHYIGEYCKYRDLILAPCDSYDTDMETKIKKVMATNNVWIKSNLGGIVEEGADENGEGSVVNPITLLLNKIKSNVNSGTFTKDEFCGRIGDIPVTANNYGKQYCKDYPIHLLALAIASNKVKVDEEQANLKDGFMSTGCFPFMPNTSRKNHISLTTFAYSLSNLGRKTSLTTEDSTNIQDYNKFFTEAFSKFKASIHGDNLFAKFLRSMGIILKYSSVTNLAKFTMEMRNRLESNGINTKLLDVSNKLGTTPISFFESLIDMHKDDMRLFEEIYRSSN